MLHRKALIADDTAVLSSFNITDRSRGHDHEIGVRSSDPAFVRTLEAVLKGDLDRGRALDPATRKGFGAWLGDLIAQRLHISY
ncbi:MAG: PLD-like domain [Thermoleophilia bacterium]|nr:PLD-like domain [Thermoleophilia bacterium]